MTTKLNNKTRRNFLLIFLSIVILGIIYKGNEYKKEFALRPQINLTLEVHGNYWMDLAERVKLTEPLDESVLIIELTIRNNSEHELAFFSKDWILTDTEGNTFNAHMSSSITPDQDLSTEIVKPWGVVNGKVAFRIINSRLPMWLSCAGYTENIQIGP